MGISINIYFKSTASNLPRHRQATRPLSIRSSPSIENPRGGCSNRIIFIVYSRSYNFDNAISRVPNGYEKYVGTTYQGGRGGEVPPLPEGKDFPRRGAKLIRAGPEILFRSLAINAKRLTGQSSPGGVNPKGVRTVLSDVHTSVVS